VQPTVLIADDHQVFAESLRSLLGSTYDVVGTAKDGKDLIELALTFKPALILTDLSMPKMNGFDAMKLLDEKGIRSKFVILTMHDEKKLAVRVFRAGASAFLLKTAGADELMKALEVVMRGGHYLSSGFSCDLITVLAEAARTPVNDESSTLTRRQREVLKLVAEGKSMKQVGDELHISTRTAESYKYHMMNSLGVRTNAELVQHAIKIGLITLSTFDAAI
jgi:DNA-binding NarL/FixJ family response regulator